VIIDILTLALGLLTCFALIYTLFAAILIARFTRQPHAHVTRPQAVTILKPLHGTEPRLAENLESFLNQRWGAPIQLLCGVRSDSDPALAAVEELKALHPDADITCVVGGVASGANGKVCNLINMMPAAKHDILILSDSDMAAPADYLRQVVAALVQPEVGAITCLYRGRGDAGFWSRLGAAGLSWQFLPGVITSLALGKGGVCMGSTIALRRATLERIGGFDRFADILADDHAIGAAVRELGFTIAVPPLVMPHGSADRSLADLVRHELRWAAPVRQINPAGYAGMIVTHPLPFALATLALSPLAGTALLIAATAMRILLIREVDRLAGTTSAPLWLLPLRDILSLGIFLAGFTTGSVDWRGERLKMNKCGQISADVETM